MKKTWENTRAPTCPPWRSSPRGADRVPRRIAPRGATGDIWGRSISHEWYRSYSLIEDLYPWLSLTYHPYIYIWKIININDGTCQWFSCWLNTLHRSLNGYDYHSDLRIYNESYSQYNTTKHRPYLDPEFMIQNEWSKTKPDFPRTSTTIVWRNSPNLYKWINMSPMLEWFLNHTKLFNAAVHVVGNLKATGYPTVTTSVGPYFGVSREPNPGLTKSSPAVLVKTKFY